MPEGLFRERRRLDGKNDDGVGLLKKRRFCRNEYEAGEDRPGHGGSIYTPPIYFDSYAGLNGGEHDCTGGAHCGFYLSFDYSQRIHNLSDLSLGI